MALVAVAIVGGIVGWQVIRAGSYRDLLTVETGDFATEVEEEISYDQIPMLDKDSAEKLGNRRLGEHVGHGCPSSRWRRSTRKSTTRPPGAGDALRYGDWSKWFNNRSQGYPPISSSTW